MQFLLQAGIVKMPPRWVAVVEAFPPLPMPSVNGTRTKEIVYKEEDKYRVIVARKIFGILYVISTIIVTICMSYVVLRGGLGGIGVLVEKQVLEILVVCIGIAKPAQ